MKQKMNHPCKSELGTKGMDDSIKKIYQCLHDAGYLSSFGFVASKTLQPRSVGLLYLIGPSSAISKGPFISVMMIQQI
jgi:ribosomal protein S8